MATETAFRCPQCGEIDAVRKVSAIYNNGFSTIPNDSPLVPYGVVDKTITTITSLAQKIAPPPEPKDPGGMNLGCLFLLFIVFLIASSTSWIFALGITITLAFLVNYFLFMPLQKEYKELKPEWDEAIRRWSELYYCSRDDCVFNPNTGESVPPERISALIY